MSCTITTRRARERFVWGTAYHLVGMVLAFLFLAPLVWSALVSFKPAFEARQPPLPPWPTTGFSIDNYLTLTRYGAGLWTYAYNSAFVATFTVVLSVIIAVLAGYGFSRFNFPLKNVMFVLLISPIMIPFQSILTPLFLILSKLGLQNTLLGLVLIYVTLQMPFSIFMMRNAFDSVPKEVEDAARVDGATVVQVLLRVMLPLVAPGIVTVAMFAFINSWNEFLAALIFLTDQNKYTLPILISSVTSGRFGSVDWGAVQAGVTIMMVPCLVIFLALQRYYMRGLMVGAVK